MFNKQYSEFRKMKFGLINLALFVIFTTTGIAAQTSAEDLQSDGFSWWTIVLFLLIGCLIIGIFYRYKTKNTEELSATPYKRVSYPNSNSGKTASASDKDIERLRKNRKVGGKPEFPKKSTLSIDKAQTIETQKTPPGTLDEIEIQKTPPVILDEIEELSDALPIYSFLKLRETKPFDALPVSNEEALMSAIEQLQEEFDEDEEIRSLAVRILAACRTSNSVEALSQVALYDLSSNLRSTAVTTLSEFDHESVFETILLACADPTREVRAAAARALFRLTFNRADAWARIANSSEQGRIVQMARAAIEADLVERSFERLVHQDRKYSYEAFALVILLIRAGEMNVITNFLFKNNDQKLCRAILHTIKVSKDKNSLDELNALMKENILSPELQEDMDKTIEEMGFVTA